MTSFAEWKQITEAEDGSTYYIDFSSIKQNNGFVYYWILIDILNQLKLAPIQILANTKLIVRMKNKLG